MSAETLNQILLGTLAAIFGLAWSLWVWMRPDGRYRRGDWIFALLVGCFVTMIAIGFTVITAFSN